MSKKSVLDQTDDEPVRMLVIDPIKQEVRETRASYWRKLVLLGGSPPYTGEMMIGRSHKIVYGGDRGRHPMFRTQLKRKRNKFQGVCLLLGWDGGVPMDAMLTRERVESSITWLGRPR